MAPAVCVSCRLHLAAPRDLGACRVPDDPWVVALPFDGWLLVGNAGEVAQVLTCLLKGGRTVICAYALVAGHDDARLERLDGVVGSDPLFARAGVGSATIMPPRWRRE